MPVNRGQGQTKRWYQICFVPSSGDSSDDSDTESVILAHSTSTPTTTTWQELSAPESSSPPPPPNSEPQIDWQFPPPPPPPPPPNPEPQIDWRFPPRPPPPPNLEPQIDWRFPPSPPPPPNPEPQIDRRFPPPLPNPEPQIDWRFPPSPPPPPNPEPQIDRRFPPPPPPPPNPEPQIDWRFPPPPPPPPNPEPQINRRFPPPPPSPLRQNIWEYLPFDIELRHDRYQQQQQPQSPSHVLEADYQSVNFLEVPIDVISRVRISELHDIENLSHSHCPICLENFKVGDRACRLPCIHIYCSECILRWLNNNKTCPVCRLQLNDWESQSGSNSIGDDHSLELETEILQMQQPIQTNSVFDWELFYPPSPGSSVIENGAGDNTEDADYDSACDEVGDSHEDRGYIVGASQSGHS